MASLKFKKDGDRHIEVVDNEGDKLRVWSHLNSTCYFLTFNVNNEDSAGLDRKQAVELALAILKEAMRDAERG